MSEEIKIEKGVPLPPRRARYRKWPFGEMLIGNSFFVEGQGHRPHSAAWEYSKRHGGRFTCRTVTENGVKGVRVWRIE